MYHNNVSWLDRFCAKHPRFGIPNLMIYFITANVVIFIFDMFSNNMLSELLELDPVMIIYGKQFWRLLTFVLVPTAMKPFWFVISVFFYYFLGTTMEREWGTAKFTLFYLSGALLTLVAAFLSEFLFQSVWMYGTGLYYIHRSLFLAFATLYPEAPMRFYFIIPIKAKWLAALWIFMEVYDIINLYGAFLFLLPMLLLPLLSAIINYLIFFWNDCRYVFFRIRRQASPNVINFKKAQKQAKKKAKETGGYAHKCAVCGVTDADDPSMEFRYCSKCDGYYCYCMNHINNHVHIHQ